MIALPSCYKLMNPTETFLGTITTMQERKFKNENSKEAVLNQRTKDDSYQSKFASLFLVKTENKDKVPTQS